MAEEDTEINASDFRSVKLPTFWRDDPRLWFAMLEREFAAYGVRSDAVKCAAVIRHLDNTIIRSVADIISLPDTEDSYRKIKDALIERIASSEEAQLRQLLTGVELDGRKPSDLLREMTLLAGTRVSEGVLQTLWLQRLPKRVQEILAVVENTKLEKLALLADKTMERSTYAGIAPVSTGDGIQQVSEGNPEIAALTRKIEKLEMIVRDNMKRRPFCRSRSRGRSNSRGRHYRWRSLSRNGGEAEQYDMCYYHRRFKENSFRCKPPCKWTGPDKRAKEN